MKTTLTKDVFLENLLRIEQLGQCTMDRVFKISDRHIASVLLWWYREHPFALSDSMDNFSELPWHALKAIGHLMFSQERTMAERRRKYRTDFAERVFEPWEGLDETLEIPKKHLWDFAFHAAMCIMHEIQCKEESEGDILQEFFNFQILHETVVPLPRNNPYAFPAREFNDLVWMNWRARALFRMEKENVLYPDRNGVMTISVCERKVPEGDMTRLYVARRDYTDIGDIVAAFTGFDQNPVGDLAGMGWVRGMQEKAISVLALMGFFLDTFKLEKHAHSLTLPTNL
jgi:hypothetical protein